MKRFIAGASCPECKASDTLYVETATQQQVVACTRCDYMDTRESDNQPKDEDESVKWH